MRGNAGSSLRVNTAIWKLLHLAQTSQNCFLAMSCLTAVQLSGSRISPPPHCCCKNICGWIFASSKQDGKKSRRAVSQQSSQSSRNIEESLYWELILGSLYWELSLSIGGEMLKNTLGTKLDPLEKKRSNRESNLR